MKNISVIGIGKLGLCFALTLERAGYNVVGLDINQDYVDSINDKTLKSHEENVEEYFNSISYDYQNDQDNLKDILRLTKTRVDDTKESFEFVYGMEQTFFIKSLAENIFAENFFEIGTGRGTSCYALSLVDKIKNITTVDIIPHIQKKYEAINFKPAIVSNLDLYELIQIPQKEKINFKSKTF